VFFSGGVADCIGSTAEDDETLYRYGDIGLLLGQSLYRHAAYRATTVCHSQETLRATVIGAGTHLVSISGSTIAFSAELLPMRNLPVLKLDEEEVRLWMQGNLQQILQKVTWFRKETDHTEIALAFSGIARPTYFEIKQLAEAVHALYTQPELQEQTPILIIEHDMAKALGQALQLLFRRQRRMVCIDGVPTQEGDYIDLGMPIMNDLVIPVVVKTLVMG